ncbi:MAG: hypothetical protein RAO92_07390 [Candidatus Euphemobacter frigidus]|nr:hypothetical protein [Candidatus Euphemobacter frigidus]MDP8276211.1 hypothetical protein [Candidatus Euphemobacter frigidus]
MPKILFIFPLIFFFVLGLPNRVVGNDRLEVHFFGSRSCIECFEIKETLLKPLAKEYPDIISLHLHEIEDKESLRLMLKLEKQYQVEPPSPQELFLPGTYLAGADAIMESGEALIRKYLADPESWEPVPGDGADTGEDLLQSRFNEMTFVGIIFAGLVDGVNPCAIATMIFLLSFLALHRRRRSQVIAIGLVFTGTVYLTYLLIGIGAFQVILMLDVYRQVSLFIRWSAVGLAGAVGLLCLRDALLYKRSGKTGDLLLQMPRPIKLHIHKLISGHLKGTHLVAGAIVSGFLVTLFEAVCTGQVYLPAIIAMTRTGGTRTTGWIYLIFYNFLFVLPLLIVLILINFGLTWHKLARTTQKNLAGLKVIMGLVLIALALYLALG